MNTPSSLLGVLFDHTIGNILRMLAVIRLPKLERGRVSRGFVATLIVIMGYGLVMLFSASYSSGYANYGDVYHFIRPQSIIAVAGLGVMWLVSNINYRALRYMNESFYIITLVLLVAALFSRWTPTVPTAGSTLRAVRSRCSRLSWQNFRSCSGLPICSTATTIRKSRCGTVCSNPRCRWCRFSCC